MSDELKPCPFCGERPTLANEFATCINEGCALFMAAIPVSIWNIRPVEDRLEVAHQQLQDLFDKFPDFDDSWPEEQKVKWMVEFRKLIETVHGVIKE